MGRVGMAPEIIATTLYLMAHALLCVHGLHRVWLLLQIRKPDPIEIPPSPATWPGVTVQLPVFNERNVVERIVARTAELDYPKDLLEIQVLDDSTDDTTSLAELACQRLRSTGFDAVVIHREDRTGFKAGALQNGLRVAKWDRIAIFDADFVPPREFLRTTVPYLETGIGLVQARWGHLNASDQLHTMLQSILLDGHYMVEQLARYRGGRWMQFNGTAGIWRRDTIEKAGGWEHDTLTEDLDLSYRAQLVGESFVYLPDLVAPAEVPPTMLAFKAQQHRWGKGMVQAFKKSIGRIWKSRAGLGHKVEATLHLSSVLSWPLVALISVPLPIQLAARELGLLSIHWVADIFLFATVTVSIAAFYVVAAVRARRRRLWWRIACVPLAMALGVGLAVAQSRAVLEGAFGSTGTFVRTPKRGDAGVSSYSARVDWIMLAELLLAVWLLGSAGVALAQGWFGAAPFMLLFGFGYGLIAGHAVVESVQRRRQSK